MLDRIFNQISKADVLVADMTGRNANVFYEVGYAHALGKIVVLLTQNADDIPFDFKHRQHILYGGEIDRLRRELATKLEWAIAEVKRRRAGDRPSRFSLKINRVDVSEGPLRDGVPLVQQTIKKRSFQLSLQLRNDGTEAMSDITHVYLFADAKTLVAPSDNRINMATLTNSPLRPLAAATVDASDGLTEQYRLGIEYKALPPGAVEARTIPMVFRGDETSNEAAYRLRLHTGSEFHEFSFRHRVTFVATPEPPSRPRGHKLATLAKGRVEAKK
jgi:hypothetical protein